MNQSLSRMLFQHDDAGRSQSKRPRSKNDCTVRAVAIACDLPFDEAYDFLARAGRRPHAGFKLPRTLTIKGYQLAWIAFQAILGQKRMTPLSFSITYPRGRYIIRVSKHVAAVVDGVIRDDYPINPARCVYGAWKVHI